MNIDRDITRMPPPLYTSLPLARSSIPAETTNPSHPNIQLAAPKLVAEKLIFRQTKKAYQIPITLIQRPSLPSYAASMQSSPPSTTAHTTASPDPPAYTPIGNGIPTNPTARPALSQITDQTTTTTHLHLRLGSCAGYLEDIPYRALLQQIQSLLETHRAIPITSDLICQCEMHLWTCTSSNLAVHPALNHPYNHPYTPLESLDHLVDRRESLRQHKPIRQERHVKSSDTRFPVQTDVSLRISQTIWEPENRGRKMLERIIRQGGVCGFEVYWWVKG